MRYLLDTNFVSELRKGERANPGVSAWAMANDPGLCALSVVTLAEIRRGIEDMRRVDTRQAYAIECWFAVLQTDFAANILPVSIAISSDKISPNRFEQSNTSKSNGRRRSCIAALSI